MADNMTEEAPAAAVAPLVEPAREAQAALLAQRETVIAAQHGMSECRRGEADETRQESGMWRGWGAGGGDETATARRGDGAADPA